jgi:hypothetical protein
MWHTFTNHPAHQKNAESSTEKPKDDSKSSTDAKDDKSDKKSS